MKNIITLKILTILLLFVMSANVYASTFLTFPLKKVSKISCKGQNFDTMSEDCKQDLQILKTKNYKKYKNNSNYQNYYTVLHGATYKDGWDPEKGAHLGVDIATAKGTPVYSMAKGKVVVAGYKYGRGKVVSIEHKINGKQVFSNYAHMSEILVKQGESVKSGKQIGKVGSSGASTGNHIHFQIDITDETRHPYRYAECSGYSNIVNRGLCRDGLLSNTIDPLLFFESNGTVFKNKKYLISKNKNKNIVKNNKKSTKKISNKNISKNINYKKNTKKIDNITRKTVKISLTEKEKRRKLSRDFRKKYEIEIITKNYDKKLSIGETRKIYFKIKDKKSNKYFNGKPPLDIIIVNSKRKTKISNNRFKKIDNSQYFEIIGNKKGDDKIYIKLGSSVIENFQLNIFDKNEKAKVKSIKLVTKDKFSIGGEEIGGLIMKDKKGNKLIKVPYEGQYKLSSNGNINFCQFGKCKNGFKKEIIFEYKDTHNGILLFKYNIKKIGRDKIKIEKIGNRKKTLLAKYVRGVKPKDLTKSNLYYNEIILLIEEGILDIKKGYFGKNKNLTDTQAKIWIEKTLLKMKKTEINSKILGKINNKLKLLSLEKSSGKILTRKDFLEKINNFLIINKENSKISLNFEDLNEQENKLANIIFDKRNTFRERNAKKFYKPEAKINQSEGAYMIKRAISINKDFLVTLR